MGNINIDLPEELHKEIKIFCAINRISIKEFLIKSLEEDSKKEANEKKKKE